MVFLAYVRLSFMPDFVPEGSAQSFHCGAKKRGHTGELDRLWWGYSLVEQHGVLVRNKYPEGSKLENQPMNIGMVWLSKNGILEIFGY